MCWVRNIYRMYWWHHHSLNHYVEPNRYFVSMFSSIRSDDRKSVCNSDFLLIWAQHQFNFCTNSIKHDCVLEQSNNNENIFLLTNNKPHRFLFCLRSELFVLNDLVSLNLLCVRTTFYMPPWRCVRKSDKVCLCICLFRTAVMLDVCCLEVCVRVWVRYSCVLCVNERVLCCDVTSGCGKTMCMCMCIFDEIEWRERM